MFTDLLIIGLGTALIFAVTTLITLKTATK
jgi:hypothetical protein